MANAIANAVDWFVDKLNRAHVVPVNAATFIRDVSAKQLSDGNFTPRPLTEDHFTNAELDAIYRLYEASKSDSNLKGKAITASLYNIVGTTNGKNWHYGAGRHGMSDILTPLRTVSTTIGQAGLHEQHGDTILKDVYDFNIRNKTLPKTYDGMYRDPSTDILYATKEEVIDNMRKNVIKDDSAYGRFRNNAIRLGHSSDDPNSQKIHARISINNIKKRLGSELGQYNILNPVSRKDFIMKSIAAGAAAGAPLGATLGALSGAMLLIDKKRRKNWVKTMLLHILGGAAIGAVALGAGGGLASSKVYDRFEKKSSFNGINAKKKRREQIKSAIIAAMAYSLPVAALAGVGGYAATKALGTYGKLLEDTDPIQDWKFKEVEESI